VLNNAYRIEGNVSELPKGIGTARDELIEIDAIPALLKTLGASDNVRMHDFWRDTDRQSTTVVRNPDPGDKSVTYIVRKLIRLEQVVGDKTYDISFSCIGGKPNHASMREIRPRLIQAIEVLNAR
jgi:hypothetical protein